MATFYYKYANIGRLCLFNLDFWRYYKVHVVTIVFSRQRKTAFLCNRCSIPVKQLQHQIQAKQKTFKTLAVANKCFITPGDASGAENMMHRAAVSTHLAVRYVLHPRPRVKYGFMCSCEHVITCMSLCSYAGVMCVLFAVDMSPLSAAAAVYTEEHRVSQQLI